MMLAISLHQPWASLLLTPAKDHETRAMRPWMRAVGKRVLIHAAKAKGEPPEGELAAVCDAMFPYFDFAALPRGGFIGSAVLTGFRRIEMPASMMTTAYDEICGDWTPGRYVWRMKSKITFPMVPAAGKQGFWDVDESLLPKEVLHG